MGHINKAFKKGKQKFMSASQDSQTLLLYKETLFYGNSGRKTDSLDAKNSQQTFSTLQPLEKSSPPSFTSKVLHIKTYI